MFKATLAKAEDGVLWSKYSKQVCGWSAGKETSTVTLQNIMQPEREPGKLPTVNGRYREGAVKGGTLLQGGAPYQKWYGHPHIEIET